MLQKTKIQKGSRDQSASSRLSPNIIRPSSLKISDPNDIQKAKADAEDKKLMMIPNVDYSNSRTDFGSKPMDLLRDVNHELE